MSNMKFLILMAHFTILALAASFTEIESKSISVENLDLNNIAEHSSRIQRRSLRKIFGLKPRYRPVISVQWRNPNKLIFTNNNRFTISKTFIRPSNFHIQKNIFFYNGISQPNPPQPYPGSEPTTSKPFLQQTESPLTTRFVTSTDATLFSEQTIKNVDSSPTTQIYQSTAFTTQNPQTTTPRTTTTRTTFTTSAFTTSRPQTTTPRTTTTRTTFTTSAFTTSRPQTTRVFTSTEPAISRFTSNIGTMEKMRGGFTSTSMPDKNQYSELIYDIDPRYRRY